MPTIAVTVRTFFFFLFLELPRSGYSAASVHFYKLSYLFNKIVVHDFCFILVPTLVNCGSSVARIESGGGVFIVSVAV